MLRITPKTNISTFIAIAAGVVVLSYLPATHAAAAEVTNNHYHAATINHTMTHDSYGTSVTNYHSNVVRHDLTVNNNTSEHSVTNVHELTNTVVRSTEKKTPCNKPSTTTAKTVENEHTVVKVATYETEKKPCNKPTPKPVSSEKKPCTKPVEKPVKTGKKLCNHSSQGTTTSTPPEKTGGNGGVVLAAATTTAPATLADTGESTLLPSLSAVLLMASALLIQFPLVGSIKKLLAR